jgi:hypothetical protein
MVGNLSWGWIAVLVGLLALAGAAYLWWRQRQPAAAPLAEPSLAPVAVQCGGRPPSTGASSAPADTAGKPVAPSTTGETHTAEEEAIAAFVATERARLDAQLSVLKRRATALEEIEAALAKLS